MRSTPTQVFRRQFALATSLVLLAGCGAEQGLPPAADPDQARAALTAGLNAWKDGRQADALKGGDPPIYFTDLAWQAGQRLEKYELDGTLDRSGQSVTAVVALTLRTQEGALIQKKVRYQIDTSPRAVVIVPGDPVAKE